MNQLWLTLAVLTLARMTMGFQFQSLAAVGPVLTADAIVSHTQLGLLIGIYLLPGTLFAIPGGWLGRRFGDKRVVIAGLAMMTLGAVLVSVSAAFEVLFAGRLVAGLGAVLLNVLVTKMVTDWFVGHRIATAMSVLVVSWPLGIAIALLTIGPLERAFGLQWAFSVPLLVCVLALALVAVVYRDAPGSASAGPARVDASRDRLSAREIRGVFLAGCVWCLYNVALILLLSFGPAYLVGRGLELSEAGAIVSLTSWLIIPALPLGALLAERINRPVTVMASTFLLILVLIVMIPQTAYYAPLFAALGLVFGPAGGLIMALPAQVLKAHNRAIGMGIFFTLYYLGMGFFPALAGYLRDASGRPEAPLYIGALAILLAALSLAGFQANLRSATKPV